MSSFEQCLLPALLTTQANIKQVNADWQFEELRGLNLRRYSTQGKLMMNNRLGFVSSINPGNKELLLLQMTTMVDLERIKHDSYVVTLSFADHRYALPLSVVGKTAISNTLNMVLLSVDITHSTIRHQLKASDNLYLEIQDSSCFDIPFETFSLRGVACKWS